MVQQAFSVTASFAPWSFDADSVLRVTGFMMGAGPWRGRSAPLRSAHRCNNLECAGGPSPRVTALPAQRRAPPSLTWRLPQRQATTWAGWWATATR